MNISDLRKSYHQQLCSNVVKINKTSNPYPNFSDTSSKASIAIGLKILDLIGFPVQEGHEKEQTVGKKFEKYTRDFIEASFSLMMHLRPGEWVYSIKQKEISRFDQYQHLANIEIKIKHDKDLSSALGRDYLVTPDIIVARSPLSDEEINRNGDIVTKNDIFSSFTPLRKRNLSNQNIKILHASISCKWTIRSDRSQNTRTEALNLIRNRKGNLPHIMAVTAEPLPTRIAALALGTGDLDCVYHFALNELREAVSFLENDDQKDILNIMVNGNRLRDISDLPFDLAI
ncbi:MAG: restriction endonuclease [Leptolinea sp.]|jgi:hypothetical protein|nr:restriction endonuclease [Leptolinea sp.]